MYKAITDEVVMIRPANFYSNPQTAGNNEYQHQPGDDLDTIQTKALEEFDNLVNVLQSKGVKVNVIQDTKSPSTPDSIFPNNWFSSHEGGILAIYPMYADDREEEITKFLGTVTEIAYKKHNSSDFFRTFDYTLNRRVGVYLEGTGAMVIDRKARTVYSTRSPRASETLLKQFCEDTKHKYVSFYAEQAGEGIYHTNVMMGIGQKIAIICLEAITNDEERTAVQTSLEKAGNVVIPITLSQVDHFLGNTLELQGTDSNFLMMSEAAYKSLTDEQAKMIEEFVPIEHVAIDTIEYYGGGSVRCMLAEIFE